MHFVNRFLMTTIGETGGEGSRTISLIIEGPYLDCPVFASTNEHVFTVDNTHGLNGRSVTWRGERERRGRWE